LFMNASAECGFDSWAVICCTGAVVVCYYDGVVEFGGFW
jgi:hypothetical protein